TFDLVLADEVGEIVAEVGGLRIQHLDQGAKRISPDRWLYDVAWQRQPLRGLPIAREPGAWLVLADGTGVSAALVERLAATGDRCKCVRTSEELSRALDDLRDTKLRGVVHAWSLDVGAPSTTRELEAAHARVIDSALAVIQRAKAPIWF